MQILKKNIKMQIPNNFGGLEKAFCRYDKSKVVILPVPYDATRKWLVGDKWKKANVNNGPTAIITASQNMELYDIELDKTIAECGIHTLNPIKVSKDPETMIQIIKKETLRHIQNNKFLVMLGGEHSVSYGYYLGLSEKYPNVSVLQIDAHADLRDSFDGTKYSHASIMARIREIAKNVVQLGIRSISDEEAELIKNKKYDIFYAKDIYDNTNWFEKAIGKIDKNVYITIDVDGFDPSVIPHTGTPEPGGLDWYTVIKFLKKVFAQKNVVGFDVVELVPNTYSRASDYTIAKLVYKLIGYKFFLK